MPPPPPPRRLHKEACVAFIFSRITRLRAEARDKCVQCCQAIPEWGGEIQSQTPVKQIRPPHFFYTRAEGTMGDAVCV